MRYSQSTLYFLLSFSLFCSSLQTKSTVDYKIESSSGKCNYDKDCDRLRTCDPFYKKCTGYP